MVDGVYNEMLMGSEERVSVTSESRSEKLLMVNNMNTGNHSSEVECNFSVKLNDGKAANEKEVRDLASPVSYSSEYVESSESSSVVEFPHFSLHRHPSEKSVAYMDKNIMECESQESKFCYKENTCQDVKDICVDEGVPTWNQPFWVDTVDENKICNLLPEMDIKKEVTKDELKSDALVLYALDLASQEDSAKLAAYQPQFENSVQMVATDTVVNDVGKGVDLTGRKTLMLELTEEDSRPSVDEGDKKEKNCTKILTEPTIGCTSDESKCNDEETVSGDPALPSIVDGFYSESLRNGCSSIGIAFQFSSPTPSGRIDPQQESEHKTENCQVIERDSGSTRITSEITHRRYDSRDDSGYLQHGFGESSFSAAGTLSSLINHSGPVAYSGSVSLRSDSSTTSTRSFAFPILQTEWASSPVRMAKADRRRLKKCKGWREGLLCCRF